MLLDSPPHFFATFILGCFVAFVIGMYFSNVTVWQRVFPKGGYLLYKKVGEYGEYDHYPSKWSPFNEPLNAWTSLIYTVLGVMVLCCGINDSYVTVGQEANNLVRAYMLSIFYGLSCMYLGVASFLFHASHAEVWRKADAGMTSGVVISVVVFGIYDRFCPPALVLPYLLSIAIVLQLSLTHGFLPYGSSDVLLPSLVAFIWATELLPRYGGVVDRGEYGIWLECCYSVLVGFLLRIVDIKRNSPSVYKNILRALLVLSIFPFSWALGLTDPVLLFGLTAWLMVCHSPYLGHIFWHFGSAGALFLWWYLLRVRPGDAVQSEGAKTDLSLISIVFFVVIKNAFRRLSMVLPFPVKAQRDQCLYFGEHLFFACLGYYCVFYLPENMSLVGEYKVGGNLFESDTGADKAGSWGYNTALCWLGAVYQSELFHMYYLAKVGAHVEDLVYMAWKQYSGDADDSVIGTPSSAPDPEAARLIATTHADSDAVKGRKKDVAAVDGNQYMVAHHVVTAMLCLSSWAMNYTRIGSLVMFLHDVSDLPLDVVRLCGSFGHTQAQLLSMAATLLAWAYWRIYYLNAYVLYSVAYESRTSLELECCSHETVVTSLRGVFLLLLGSLSALHLYWFWLMLEKTYKAVAPGR